MADTGYRTEQRKQQAQSDIGQRKADLRRDEAALAEALAHRRTLTAQVQEREAQISHARAGLAQAELHLSYTKIYAFADDTVANRQVEVGNFVQPGRLLLSAVPDDVYIFSNYKETQAAAMRAGQAARIAGDALPGTAFYGYVDNFQRGTGSTFALLPPENAAGNFVKIVQRIPVKIRFDDPVASLRRLAPGMSVETAVIIERPGLLGHLCCPEVGGGRTVQGTRALLDVRNARAYSFVPNLICGHDFGQRSQDVSRSQDLLTRHDREE